MTPPDPVRFVDERLATAPLMKKVMRYVFPDHWSFLLGELALYCFVVLVATGTFLALFYTPSTVEITWSGPYAPLDGELVSTAYGSVLDLSFKVPGGLLMRQAHHWAALLFTASIVVHMIRIFVTGAFRKPRELNYLVGVTLLGVAILEGYLGYSLLDDLLSGMGLAIGYGVALSAPLVGGPLGVLIWGGEFPGTEVFWSRLYIGHVFVLPAVLAGLIGLHLAMIVRQRHSQFPGPGRTEDNVVGSPLWPGYALRSLGWLSATAAMLFLLGGFVQINPVWQWGPYETWVGENGAQPDWYLGWLIGALRLMPPLEIQAFGRTLAPNPFFGGLLFPIVVFGVLYLWPWLEQRVFTRDRRTHHLLDRPRDSPRRTAFALGFLSWVLAVFLFGAADRVFLALDVPYAGQLWVFRFAVWVIPVVVYVVTRRVCLELQRREAHPLREVEASVVRRNEAGGFELVDPATLSAGGQDGADGASSARQRRAERA